MRSYKKCARNSLGMRTYKIIELKVSQNEQLQKTGGGSPSSASSPADAWNAASGLPAPRGPSAADAPASAQRARAAFPGGRSDTGAGAISIAGLSPPPASRAPLPSARTSAAQSLRPSPSARTA